MIALIDYGMGNLASVRNALEHLGADVERIDRRTDLSPYEAVILPGVGAFDEARDRLRKSGLDQMIIAAVLAGRPFLGICLGMQLLFEESEEGKEKGLGILAGQVRRFPDLPGLLIPHVGWNELCLTSDRLTEEHSYMYFVHSFYVSPSDPSIVSAVCRYGIEFAAAVSRDNVTAFQFHPEKSGDQGLALLGRWLKHIRSQNAL